MPVSRELVLGQHLHIRISLVSAARLFLVLNGKFHFSNIATNMLFKNRQHDWRTVSTPGSLWQSSVKRPLPI